ncbi:MAG: hypothetical protein IT327_32375 [Anaerolineae bacterium]|nr:hypothetical protein [Anaerolineae bacterium]
MSPFVLQYVHLENLLAEAGGSDALRVHVLEQTETTSSNVLTWREISIGVCVRAITPNRRILSWYCPIDKFGFYAPEHPGQAQAANGQRSPEQKRYDAAWEQATRLQNSLVARLRQEEQTVTTDGVIELQVARYLPGTTRLVLLPTKGGRTTEAT